MKKEEILNKMIDIIDEKNCGRIYIAHVLPPSDESTVVNWSIYDVKETFFRLLADSIIYLGRKFIIVERVYWYEEQWNRHCILLKGHFENS